MRINRLKVGQKSNQHRLAWLLLSLCLFGLSLLVVDKITKAPIAWEGILFLGSANSSECIIPNSYALYLQEKNAPHRPPLMIEMHLQNGMKKTASLFIKDNAPLKIEILKYLPHVSQKLKCFYQDRVRLALGTFPSSFIELMASSQFSPICMWLQNKNWSLAATYTQSIGEAIASLSSRKQEETPLIAFFKDKDRKEYLLTKEDSQIQLFSLDSLLKEASITWGMKKDRCQLAIPLPFGSTKESLFLEAIPSFQIQEQIEDSQPTQPCLYALFTQGKKSEDAILCYDPFFSAPSTSLFLGQYNVRFQPLKKQLPFQVAIEKWECTHDLQGFHTKECQISFLLTDQKGHQERGILKPDQTFRTKEGYLLSLTDNHQHFGDEYKCLRVQYLLP